MNQPNIVVLLSDQMQQRAVLQEDSGCIMRNLKELRADGVTFPNAHTVNPICSPARASLITGMLPHNHGMVDCTHTVPEYRSKFNTALPNLPKLLKEAGYNTCYYGKWHIERSYKLENFGFDEYETELKIPKRELTPVSRVTVQTEGYRDNTVAGVYAEGEDISEEHYIYDRAMNYIDRHLSDDKPFCAFVSTYAPHDPYVIPKEIYDLYDESVALPESWTDNLEDRPAIYRRLQRVWKDVSEEQVRQIIRCYYGYCTLVDVQIGRLMTYLKEKGVYDNTVIVMLSDHGDMVGGHGLFCKGVPAFEEDYAIPLVMKLPAEECRGMECAVYADTCDVMPTVLSAAGIPYDAVLDGKNLLPYIKGEEHGETYTLAEFHGQRFSYTQRVVWSRGMKYVYNTFDEDELYDLKKDPRETKNLSDDPAYQKEKRRLAGLMWRRVIETNDWSLRDSHYFMHRIAPIGPCSEGSGKDFGIYNKTF